MRNFFSQRISTGTRNQWSPHCAFRWPPDAHGPTACASGCCDCTPVVGSKLAGWMSEKGPNFFHRSPRASYGLSATTRSVPADEKQRATRTPSASTCWAPYATSSPSLRRALFVKRMPSRPQNGATTHYLTLSFALSYAQCPSLRLEQRKSLNSNLVVLTINYYVKHEQLSSRERARKFFTSTT